MIEEKDLLGLMEKYGTGQTSAMSFVGKVIASKITSGEVDLKASLAQIHDKDLKNFVRPFLASLGEHDYTHWCDAMEWFERNNKRRYRVLIKDKFQYLTDHASFNLKEDTPINSSMIDTLLSDKTILESKVVYNEIFRVYAAAYKSNQKDSKEWFRKVIDCGFQSSYRYSGSGAHYRYGELFGVFENTLEFVKNSREFTEKEKTPEWLDGFIDNFFENALDCLNGEKRYEKIKVKVWTEVLESMPDYNVEVFSWAGLHKENLFNRWATGLVSLGVKSKSEWIKRTDEEVIDEVDEEYMALLDKFFLKKAISMDSTKKKSSKVL